MRRRPSTDAKGFRRITVTVPETHLDMIDREWDNRSAFVSQAVREKLRADAESMIKKWSDRGSAEVLGSEAEVQLARLAGEAARDGTGAPRLDVAAGDVFELPVSSASRSAVVRWVALPLGDDPMGLPRPELVALLLVDPFGTAPLTCLTPDVDMPPGNEWEERRMVLTHAWCVMPVHRLAQATLIGRLNADDVAAVTRAASLTVSWLG